MSDIVFGSFEIKANGNKKADKTGKKAAIPKSPLVSPGKKAQKPGTRRVRRGKTAPPNIIRTQSLHPAAVPRESEQSRFAKKIKLDQIASSVIGGTTGLLMLLDVMLNDVKEGDTNSFYFHADSYVQRLDRLEKLLNSYQQLGVENREVQQYQGLLEIGKGLRTLPAPEKITKEMLDGWQAQFETWLEQEE